MNDGRRVCLLTGAGGRLGTAFCRTLADRYRIAAVYRSAPPEVATQHQRFVDPLLPDSELAENGKAVFAICSDLEGEGEPERVTELALAHYGRIDLVVNAVGARCWAPIVESHELLDSAGHQLAVNTLVPLRVSAAVARAYWRTRDRDNRRSNRNVVNVSSAAGVYVYEDLGQSAYSASKAALNFLSCHMASEFARFGVRVNALAPDTFPGRVSIARVLDGVIGLDNGSETGTVLVVDGEGEESFRP